MALDAIASASSASVARRTAMSTTSRLARGSAVAVGVLCAVEGSAPFSAGALLAVGPNGVPEGSITGGCIEAEVVESAVQALAGHRPPQLLDFGISDELAGRAGLLCGGTVSVLVDVLRPGSPLARFVAARAVGAPGALALGLDGSVRGRAVHRSADGAVHSDLPSGADALAVEQALEAAWLSGRGRVVASGPQRWQMVVDPPSPRMMVIGAVDYAAALAPLAASVGFAVRLCDPRSAFARAERFAALGGVDTRWPSQVLREQDLRARDAVLVLTHDPKLDMDALRAALASSAGYVGALGSRRTTEDRAARLRAAGVTWEQLERLHAPAGLDIGSSSAEETAVAIVAEVLAVRSGRSARELRSTGGPIRVLDAPGTPAQRPRPT